MTKNDDIPGAADRAVVLGLGRWVTQRFGQLPVVQLVTIWPEGKGGLTTSLMELRIWVSLLRIRALMRFVVHECSHQTRVGKLDEKSLVHAHQRSKVLKEVADLLLDGPLGLLCPC